MAKLTPLQMLDNLADALVEDILAMSDEDILAEADEAMYTAKKEGRNRIAAYVTETGARRRRTARLTLESYARALEPA